MADVVAEHIAALKDGDWAVREEAAVALGTLQDPRAVAPLVSILRDSDRAVRQAAIGALRAIGEPSIPALGSCLSAPQLEVQEAASAILASIADERVLAPLTASLGNKDWIVRMHAAQALGRIKSPDSVEPLLPLLQDKVKAVREEAAMALAAIGDAAVPSLISALAHADWLVRLHAVEALGRMRSPASVDPLLSVLFNDRDTAVREDVVRALGQIGDERAVEFLVVTMKEPGLRPLAVEALGQIGDRRAVPILIKVVEGTDQPMESRVVAGCGDRWDEEMVTRGAAVRALGMLGDDAAISALLGALRDTVTRADAAAALARFGSKVIPPLLGLLSQETTDDNFRFHVKETLAAVGWRPGRL
ncbi:MAG TPA: HEAT repeat domain-containing protein [Nitrospira sp.]|nr:HEAT repeat domain-containing protein [Nitrospira sp.]